MISRWPKNSKKRDQSDAMMAACRADKERIEQQIIQGKNETGNENKDPKKTFIRWGQRNDIDLTDVD
jgi:predicted NUDIX family NTP pyrophosphohydrolase